MQENNWIVVHNDREMQFEVHTGNAKAYLTYRLYKKDIALMHTFVPDVLAGKGIASALAIAAFRYAAQHQKPVMVFCPFVSGFLQRNPEYKTQLDPQYRG